MDPRADWEKLAACRDHPTSWWFPERGVDGTDNHGSEAKKTCATCPVLRPCLEGAVDRHEQIGIWGRAGGGVLRWLGRERSRDVEEPGGWEDAFAKHLRRLDGDREAVNMNGPGTTHGSEVTCARGCRCPPCRDGVKVDRRHRDALRRQDPVFGVGSVFSAA